MEARKRGSDAQSYKAGMSWVSLYRDALLTTSFYPIPFFIPVRETNGDIAQLARAAALQAVGRGFESPYLHEAARVATRGTLECSFT